jgi:ADP-heptose:LPS heptosyltransferase
MFDYLHLYNTRDRWAVGCADLLLAAATTGARWSPPKRVVPPAHKILLLRMERIGDLLMAVPAITALRTRAAGAELHLVVGSWNEELARLIPGVTRIETLDPRWLSRDTPGASTLELIRRAAKWRATGFDLAVNFEPDIRTNGLLALSGAPHRVGFHSGGGGAFLTRALPYDTTAHTTANALRLVDTIYPGSAAKAGNATVQEFACLDVPEEARQEVVGRLADAGPLVIGINPSGGRRLKQWDPDRFAQAATRLARAHHATVALIGAPEDRPLVNTVRDALPEDVRVIDFAGQLDLVGLAALCERLTVLITGDTGPLHLAAAVGTATVAIFGPSDPRRYAPLTLASRVVRTDLWCSPCNRIRLPPIRCRGRMPDCLAAVDIEDVCRAADELLVAESRDAPTLDSRRP